MCLQLAAEEAGGGSSQGGGFSPPGLAKGAAEAAASFWNQAYRRGAHLAAALMIWVQRTGCNHNYDAGALQVALILVDAIFCSGEFGCSGALSLNPKPSPFFQSLPSGWI